MDQFFLIQSLSKNIPVNCKLLIKEHPSMIEAHSRGKEFYKEISNLPNVEIVDFKLSGTEIVKKAKLVVILDGSSAIEAILMGVPVLTMSNFLYSFLGLSIKNTNLSNLNDETVPSSSPSPNRRYKQHEALTNHTIIKHPTQKPMELTKKLILSNINGSGNVLIPFSGSGSDCVVAKSLGVPFLGIDINPIYVDFGKSWLKQ